MARADRSDQDVQGYLKSMAGRIDEHIDRCLSAIGSQEELDKLLGNRSDYAYDMEAIRKGVVEPIRYMLELGGKRWRPTLMLEVISALGRDPERYMDFAIIPELIHNATLVHDDVEDNSPKRRGADAIFVKYGQDVAINLGSTIYYIPIAFLMNSRKLDAGTKERVLDIYIREMLRVHLGQAMDIVWHRQMVDPFGITEAQYMQMVFSKTGVLPRMAAMLGGALAGADEQTIQALGKFGGTIGVAFQLQDDLLNITESELARGKGGVGDDISEGKMTLMVIRALHTAPEKERKRLLEILRSHTKDKALIREAISIIDRSGAKDYVVKRERELFDEAWSNLARRLPESEGKERLRQLADFLINRSV